jgi:hypothetical protein
MGRWNSVESIQSSTWRELEAVYRVLLSLLDIIQGQKVKWYTDNHNIVHILNKGSRKIDLQQISIKIANVCTLRNRTTGPIAPCIEIISQQQMLKHLALISKLN